MVVEEVNVNIYGIELFFGRYLILGREYFFYKERFRFFY